jgi:Tol biopolymer transport system component
VWRAHYPAGAAALADYRSRLAENLTTPMKMELLVADAAGRKPRQITSFGCASFAPSFTPDGRQIIFASNKQRCDSRFFELFLANTDGTGLEQVTFSGGFNSFPVFSPDGRKLLFISDRNAKERFEFNVFIADWEP